MFFSDFVKKDAFTDLKGLASYHVATTQAFCSDRLSHWQHSTFSQIRQRFCLVPIIPLVRFKMGEVEFLYGRVLINIGSLALRCCVGWRFHVCFSLIGMNPFTSGTSSRLEQKTAFLTINSLWKKHEEVMERVVLYNVQKLVQIVTGYQLKLGKFLQKIG